MTDKSKVTNNQKKPTRRTKSQSKQDTIIDLMLRIKGASLAEISKVTDWQEQTIRGFLSATIKKRLGLNLESFKSSKGERRYRIVTVELEVDEAPSPELQA